jgi:hypothetical protein
MFQTAASTPKPPRRSPPCSGPTKVKRWLVPPTVEEIADDIAGQVVLALAELDDITLNDVIAALDRLRALEHGDRDDQFCLFPAARD